MRGQRLKKIFCGSGYEEPVFDEYMEEIALQNSRMVETTSFIGGLIMLGLTGTSIFVSSISKVRPLYAGIAVAFCLIYLFVKFICDKSSKTTIWCNYAFLTIAFAFAIGLDIIQGNVTATTVCVLLVALPLLIVDKPYREFLFFLLISILFIFESIYIKQSPKASVDVVNAISFWGIGTFLGYKHSRMVLRNIINQRKLEFQRDTDALTNLYNKNAFEGHAKSFLEQSEVEAGIMIIDMDNFKYINDTYGHQSGDEILKKVGDLLATQFRRSDYVCRFGGDEFVAFIPHVSDKEVLRQKAEAILEGVKGLRISADESYRAQFCMGVAIYPEDGKNFEEIFRNADDAMYRVKKNGKNGYAFYDAAIKKKILVVDDIEMNRAILKKILSTEYEVLEAEDGAEALAVLEKAGDVSLIITDIQMPGMNGLEMIRRVRSAHKYHNVAIIAETQYGDTKQETEILGLGADDFIYKAASPGVIQKRVKNVIHAREV